MRTILLLLLICTYVSVGCSQSLPQVIYLHGKIIEQQGIQAVSPEFGPYQFEAIIDSLKATPAVVYAEVRSRNTEFEAFGDKVVRQIDSLVQAGVAANNITVLGASKGAVMAMYISDKSPHPINYILLGANNDDIEDHYNWQLHGRVLAFYEQSDSLAGKAYDIWKERPPELISFQQIKLHTGFGHGKNGSEMLIITGAPHWLWP